MVAASAVPERPRVRGREEGLVEALAPEARTWRGKGDDLRQEVEVAPGVGGHARLEDHDALGLAVLHLVLGDRHGHGDVGLPEDLDLVLALDPAALAEQEPQRHRRAHRAVDDVVQKLVGSVARVRSHGDEVLFAGAHLGLLDGDLVDDRRAARARAGPPPRSRGPCAPRPPGDRAPRRRRCRDRIARLGDGRGGPRSRARRPRDARQDRREHERDDDPPAT